MISGKADAATYYVDGYAPTCSNGATNYIPASRSCSGGTSATVYTNLRNAVSEISPGTSGSPNVVNIRSGKYTTLTPIALNKAYTTYQKYSGDSAKPHFTAGFADPKQWEAMLQILADNVTIDGLEISEFGMFGDTTPPGTPQYVGVGIASYDCVDNITIKNCKIHHIGGNGIMLKGSGKASNKSCSSENALIDNNEIYWCQLSYYNGYRYTWGPAIGVYYYTNNVTITNNLLYNIRGEGMILGIGGRKFYVHNNKLWDIKGPALFLDQAQDVVAKHNLIFHTNKDDLLFGASGITVSAEWWKSPQEVFEGSHNIDIIGNVVLGTKQGIGIGQVHTQVTITEEGKPPVTYYYPKYRVSNVRFYNNLVIATWHDGDGLDAAFQIRGAADKDNPLNGPIILRNNIFLAEGAQYLTDIGNKVTQSYIDADYNLWSHTPQQAKLSSGANNQIEPNWATTYFNRTSWPVTFDADIIKMNDFALKSGAVKAIGKGQTLTDSTFVTGVSLDSDLSQLLNWNAVSFDTFPFGSFSYSDQGSSAWDIGAGVYGGGDTPPGSPSGLSVR